MFKRLKKKSKLQLDLDHRPLCPPAVSQALQLAGSVMGHLPPTPHASLEVFSPIYTPRMCFNRVRRFVRILLASSECEPARKTLIMGG